MASKPVTQLNQFEPGSPFPSERAEPLLATFARLWGVDAHARRNPCAQPVSLERRHLPLLLSDDYVVADKSDGVRLTLFLTQHSGQSFSLLVDRKLDCFQIPIAANKRAFQGSIFDGELVWQRAHDGSRDTQVFLVFDVVAFRGSNEVQSWDYFRRLELIRGVFDLDGRVISSPEQASRIAKEGKIICGGNAHGLSFRPKPCLPMSQLDTLLRQLCTLPYATDGLIFTPVNAPVRAGTAETTFKLKSCHTVDLEVRSGQFYVGLGGTPETATERVALSSIGAPLRPDCEFWQRFQDALQGSHAAAQATLIAECRLYLSSEGETLMAFAGRRGDKAHPNTVRTVLATLTNLRENIQADELLGRARSIDTERAGDSSSSACKVPMAAGSEASAHGGATLANVAVGDALDAQRFTMGSQHVASGGH